MTATALGVTIAILFLTACVTVAVWAHRSNR